MFKISIKPQWQLDRGEQRQVLPRLVELLVRIHETGSLASACTALNLSYRYAWGALREGEQVFGTPLVRSVRGRGAVLTPLGETLVWADKRIAARLSPMLDSLASELEVEVERAVSDSKGILRMHASHGFAVEALRKWFLGKQIPLDLKYRTSQEALSALSRGSCDMAGFHIPVGAFQAPMLANYAQWLRPDSQCLVELATRRQGLIVARGNPLGIQALEDLVRPDVRFVNRQFGSGTRVLLDLMLDKAGIETRQIDGYDTGEFTHAAVAAYVASDMADTGFGVETAARRFDLHFVPIVTERYFFGCSRDLLDTPVMQRVLQTLRSHAFQATINDIPGYDALEAGMVLDIHEAFPSLPVQAPARAARSGRAKVRGP